MAYAIQILPAAQRQLAKLDPPARAQIAAAIEALAGNPRPPGVKKLSGKENLWRIRVGSYRIIYQIFDRVRLVVIVAIGHRRDVYR